MQTENAYIETDLGNIALNPRGEYSDETSYEYLDTVSYLGGSYMCLAELTKNISGIAPESGENTQYWQMLTLPGQLTPGAIAMHDDIVNKSKQVETSRGAVELSQQAVEDAQVDVRQMRQDTQEASESAIASRDAAAGYAQAAEASRTAAAESEQNINAQVNNFNTHVSEKTSVAEASIEEARKKAINAVTTQQDLSIKAVTDEETRQTNAAIKAVTTQQNNSVQAIADEASEQIKKIKDSLDKGLSEEGKAADAKATGEAISVLREDIVDLNDKKITKFYASNQGETHITDSDNGKIVDMMIYGKSSQDGTPSPENPVEIKSVVNPAIKARGKNLFNKNAFVSFDNVYINEDTTVVYGDNNRGFVIKLNKGTYYYTQRIVHTDVQVAVFKNRPELGSVAEKVTRNNINVEIVLNDTSYLFVKYSHSVSDNDIPLQSILDSILLIYKGDNTSYEPYKEQSIQLPYTLNAIPVSEGGNVTINEQQYIADYVDIEKGKLYRKVKRLNLKDINDAKITYGLHSNGNGYLSISSESNVNKEQWAISNQYKSSAWTDKSGYLYIPSSKSIVLVDDRFTDRQTAIKLVQDTYVIYALSSQTEEDLSLKQIESLKSLFTYYPATNISVNSEQLDGYTVFNYPISMANGWNYVKQQLNDNRDYIYDMDLQSAEAYVNSEYAVALTELEV